MYQNFSVKHKNEDFMKYLFTIEEVSNDDIISS
jgi:hypothetical protein